MAMVSSAIFIDGGVAPALARILYPLRVALGMAQLEGNRSKLLV